VRFRVEWVGPPFHGGEARGRTTIEVLRWAGGSWEGSEEFAVLFAHRSDGEFDVLVESDEEFHQAPRGHRCPLGPGRTGRSGRYKTATVRRLQL
jgi:hypothetical protein